jgi:putative transposase
MARSIRIEFPGAFYHVLARGNRREAIFSDEEDRRYFLKVLSEACGRTGWRIHAWVLLNNHYHLMLETPEANLVEGMKWVQNTYTRRFNLRHGLWGRLFGDRYKSVLVEGEGFYYETLLDYIHLNPARARLVNPERAQSVLDYAWSSLSGGMHCHPKGGQGGWQPEADWQHSVCRIRRMDGGNLWSVWTAGWWPREWNGREYQPRTRKWTRAAVICGGVGIGEGRNLGSGC